MGYLCEFFDNIIGRCIIYVMRRRKQYSTFEIFDFKIVRVRFWPLTFRGHLESNFSYHSRVHTWLLIWLLLTLFISYRFEIFDVKIVLVRPWQLTIESLEAILFLISNILILSTSLSMHDFLANIYWIFPLSLTVFEILVLGLTLTFDFCRPI